MAAETSCPSDETVALFVEGSLSQVEEQGVRRHVDGCNRCREVLAGLVGAPEEEPAAEVAPERRGPARQPKIGEVVRRRYRVDAVIGTGGMATVYRAHHLGLGRAVALKVMRNDLIREPDATRRFAHEGRSAAAIDHPNAVRILDIDELDDGGTPFLVMEYLDGRDLSTVVASEHPLELERAIGYILQAIAGVGAGHALRIVHRDLKPHNLILTSSDVVKVVDFGLAKTLPLAMDASTSQHTKTSTLLGSPHYMSPEQVRSSRKVDERTDIWALGATLFHLITGKTPFIAPNLYLLCARVLSDEPAAMSRLRPEVPPWLDAVVKRCMRKNVAERYQSLRDLEDALRDDGQGYLEVTTTANPPRAPREPSDTDDTERISLDYSLIERHGGLSAPTGPPPSTMDDFTTQKRQR